MKIRLFTIILMGILLVFATTEALAQEWAFYSQPQITVGGSAALFRISLENFTSVYKGRLGPSYGGFAGLRFYGSYYALVKYRNFEQSGREGLTKSGEDLSKARWQETWYTLGIRVHPPLTRRTHSYYGFGIVFYDVNESEGLSVFPTNANDNKDLGNGFYLELGLEYFVMQKVSSFFEMEISSGGQSGKTGFEAFSVGGFRFALGLSMWLF